MQIIFLKSKWEVPEISLEAFSSRASDAGFDGTELFLPLLAEGPGTVRAMHERYGLELALAIATQGATPDDHLRDLERSMARAAEYRPLVVNGHVGRDVFSFADNVRLIRAALELADHHGLRFVLETHRGRPTYSAIDTRRYLEEIPDLDLNADISHWMTVHESDLRDQPEAIELTVRRCRHIHARVGYEEGPQVPDFRAPEWEGHVRRHVSIWRDIVEHCRLQAVDRICVTPEFGPAPYQLALPYTRQPVADVWELNVAMKDMLLRELR